MKIIFITIAWPLDGQHNLYSDLMEEFTKHGHNVYVVTTTERRRQQATNLSQDNGLQVLKVKCGNIQKVNFVEKGISLLMINSLFQKAIKKHFRNVSFDLVIMSTPPVNLLKTYAYMKKRNNAKSYLLLKDIWPAELVGAGAIQENGLIHKYFRYLEKSLYQISDYIGCMSPANVDYVVRHNPELNSKKVEENPNSIKIRSSAVLSQDMKYEIRRKYGIPTNKIVFVYGGNIGVGQGVSFIIDCIRSNENNEKAYFLIVGAGTEFCKLEIYFREEKPNNAQLCGKLPKDEYEQLCGSCDVGLIYLNKKTVVPNFPSRLLSYMQNSMPILMAIDRITDIGTIAQGNGFGKHCEWGDLTSFNKLINEMVDPNRIKEMGDKAYGYLLQHYTSNHSYEIIVKHFNII